MLTKVERKVLGALLILADDDMSIKTPLREVARVMGYKEVGGVITYAIQTLALKRFIQINNKGDYTVLV